MSVIFFLHEVCMSEHKLQIENRRPIHRNLAEVVLYLDVRLLLYCHTSAPCCTEPNVVKFTHLRALLGCEEQQLERQRAPVL